MQGGWSDEGRGGGYQGFYQEGGGHQGGGGGKEVTELKTIKGASRALVTLQEGIKAKEVVTNTTTTGQGWLMGVVGEEDRGRLGKARGSDVLTKEDSLNSSSSRVASSTIKQALARGAETTLIEKSAGH